MKSAVGTLRSGRVEFDTPVDWPEGSKVEIVMDEERIGLTESEWPDTPEGIARLLEKMRELEPLELSDSDREEIAAARAEAREISIRAVKRQMEEGVF